MDPVLNENIAKRKKSREKSNLPHFFGCCCCCWFRTHIKLTFGRPPSSAFSLSYRSACTAWTNFIWLNCSGGDFSPWSSFRFPFFFFFFVGKSKTMNMSRGPNKVAYRSSFVLSGFFLPFHRNDLQYLKLGAGAARRQQTQNKWPLIPAAQTERKLYLFGRVLSSGQLPFLRTGVRVRFCRSVPIQTHRETLENN